MQAVHARLHGVGDVCIAVFDDCGVVCVGGVVTGPVERRQELDGELRRQWPRQQRRYAERRSDHERQHVDAEAGQAERSGQRLAASGHDDGVVCAVGDCGHHRDAASQRESHEPAVVAEVDPVAIGPRSAGVMVAAGEDQYGGVRRERALGVAAVGGDRTGPTQ